MSVNIELMTSGNMWKVLVELGQTVTEGETLFIMEVMKMEVPHEAPIAGTISEVNIVNDQEGLDAGFVAIVID